MGIVNIYRDFKHKYSLKQFERQVTKVKFQHEFIDFEKANSIGFIINLKQSTPKDLVDLTEYITKLEDTGKKIYLIEINISNKAEPVYNDTQHSIFIGPGDINWLGLPSRDILKKINRLKCDILLNLDTSEEMTSRYVCGFSNAYTRVGIYKEGMENFYELMIEANPVTKLKSMLQHFEFFLKMIEK